MNKMNKMMYKEINVNKVLYKILTIKNFDFKNILKLSKIKRVDSVSWWVRRVNPLLKY